MERGVARAEDCSARRNCKAFPGSERPNRFRSRNAERRTRHLYKTVRALSSDALEWTMNREGTYIDKTYYHCSLREPGCGVSERCLSVQSRLRLLLASASSQFRLWLTVVLQTFTWGTFRHTDQWNTCEKDIFHIFIEEIRGKHDQTSSEDHYWWNCTLLIGKRILINTFKICTCI